MNSSHYVPSFSIALVQLSTMRGISDPVAMMYWSTSPPKSLGTSPGIELPYASTPTVTGGLQGGRGREGGREGVREGGGEGVTLHTTTHTFCSSVGSRHGVWRNVHDMSVERSVCVYRSQ